jgi:transcriptional regulator with XRE-family HTH domain
MILGKTTDTMMKLKIGDRLLAIREERKLSQSELADLLEISQSTYSRIEKNDASVAFEKLATFADALQIPIQELLPETLSIRNHTEGYGCVNFGNCTNYHYYNSEGQIEARDQRIIQLEQKLEEMEAKLKNI